MKNYNIALENGSLPNRYKQLDVSKYAQIVKTNDNKYYIDFKLTGSTSKIYKNINFNNDTSVFLAETEDGETHLIDILGKVSTMQEICWTYTYNSSNENAKGLQLGKFFADYLLKEPLSPYIVTDDFSSFNNVNLKLMHAYLFVIPKFREMIKQREKVLYKKFLEKKMFRNHISALAYKLESKRIINAKTKFGLKEAKQRAEAEELFAEVDKKYPLS